MKVQGNRYINNPEMIKNKVEKKTTVPQNIISEDDVKISDSARKLVETARDKVSDFQAMHFSSINGEIKEIPAEYKCENLFKLDLKATSISGEQSAFEGCLENQSEVFGKWLDENASEYLTEDEMKDLKEKINTMTADMDSLNAQEGYRGTSYESVFLLSASEAGLRKVNEMYVPEQLQAGFSDMIDEYVHFNDSARNSIMEKMTPDYMVVGIGSKTESYKYKSEIISDLIFCFIFASISINTLIINLLKLFIKLITIQLYPQPFHCIREQPYAATYISNIESKYISLIRITDIFITTKL